MFIKVEINHYGYIHSMRNEEPEVLETICSVSNKITFLHVIDTNLRSTLSIPDYRAITHFEANFDL
jgi:hypothetical protein